MTPHPCSQAWAAAASGIWKTGVNNKPICSSEDSRTCPDLWKANLAAFLAILTVAISVAVWQSRYLDQAFMEDARDHARLAAEIIRLNAQNAIEAKQTSRKIISSFLKSQTRFIEYLQQTEPFTQGELSAFAAEAGLAGITILAQFDKAPVESKEGWAGKEKDIKHLCQAEPGLHVNRDRKIFFFVSPARPVKHPCIITGIDAGSVLAIQERISLDNILKQVSGLAGVKFVYIADRETVCTQKNGWDCPQSASGRGAVSYMNGPDGPVVKVHFPFDKQRLLILGMDASSLQERQHNIWILLGIFSMALCLAGGLVTWWLYRHQAAYLARMQDYDRQLLEKRHEASLGRSAAIIAHEIRNPLNSVSMGIQKLIINSDSLSGKQADILRLLQGELARTEKIIAGLLSYARPITPDRRPLLLSGEIRKALSSLEARHRRRNTGIDLKIMDEIQVTADPLLIRQVFENTIGNAMEAQPEGGTISIELSTWNGYQTVRISNKGDVPGAEFMRHIFEPYTTGKTKGTGLGLAICRRIIAAHSGYIRAWTENDTFFLEIGIPLQEDTGG